jgi:hypothetical protein
LGFLIYSSNKEENSSENTSFANIKNKQASEPTNRFRGLFVSGSFSTP